MKRHNSINILLVLFALVLIVACDGLVPAGEDGRLDDIPADLGRQLTALNYCQSSSDCLLIDLQCDIGCFVNAQEEQQARQIAAQIDQAAPRNCDSPESTAFAPPVECIEDRCRYPGAGTIGDPLEGCYFLSQF